MTEAKHLVEHGRRLSESVLWQLQRDLYDSRGIQSWAHGSVPQTITTTPFIARAYAKVALGFVRDIAAQVDPDEPIYVVELGAGSGRFGYRFCLHFADLLERSPLQHTTFKYVMTDVSPGLVEYWQAHPKLQSLVASGVMDFGVFDAIQLNEITLVNARRPLRDIRNPIILLANYFFDSVPHDSFTIREHELYENLVRITSDTPDAQLGGLNVTFEPNAITTEYYPEPARNRVLEEYRQHLDNVMLLFPVAGMACVRHFKALAQDQLLVIAGDIGSAQEYDMGDSAAGGVGAEHNFWLEVNFHALGGYVRELGGHVWHPPFRHANLNISTFAFGRSEFAETALAYDDAVARLGPDDFFIDARVISNQFKEMSRGELLAFLRTTGWDSDYCLQMLPFLMDSLVDMSWVGRQDLRRVVEETWRMYYPLGHDADPGDLAFGFGVLLYTIGEPAAAIEYFHYSLDLFGVDARTTFNIALCLYRLERLAEALEWVDRTLELDPDAEQASEMRATLSQSLSR